MYKFSFGSLQGNPEFSSLFSCYLEIVHPLFSEGFPSFYIPLPFISALHLYVLGYFLRYLSHQDPFECGKRSC